MPLQANLYKKLTKILDYEFNDKRLAERALTLDVLGKRAQQTSLQNNQALATLGDGLLRAIIEDILLEINANATKGKLSQVRDKLVNNNLQTQIAMQMGLAEFIMTSSKKLDSKSRASAKILADCLEAIIGAVFLDSQRNYLAVKRFVIIHWGLIDIYNFWLAEGVSQKDAKQVAYLLDCGANANLFVRPLLEKVIDDSEDIANLKKCEIVGVGLEPDEYGMPPIPLLIATVDLKAIEVVKTLLEHKAEVNGRDFLGKTALYTAAYQGNVSMAKLLRAHSADVSIPVWCDGYTPLHIAVHQKHLDMVEFLLQEKANVNQQDSLGRTPLHIAALVAHVDIAKCLLRYKAEVNITRTSSDLHLAPPAEQRFETPLHVAAQSDYPFVSVAKSVAFIKILKEYGVDFDAVDYLGQTPLHRAAANGHYLIVRQLLQYGAKSEIVDNNGCKPIDLTSDSNIKDLLLSVKQSNNKSFYKEAHQSPLLFATPTVQTSSSREFEQVEQIILPPPNSYIEDDWEFRPACTIL